jgi:hypothetical protein
MAKEVKDMDLNELVQLMSLREDSPQHLAAKAEITARQIRIQREATEAQKLAADAEKLAADASVRSAQAAERNAKYMLASVIVAALAAIAAAFSAYYTYKGTIHEPPVPAKIEAPH